MERKCPQMHLVQKVRLHQIGVQPGALGAKPLLAKRGRTMGCDNDFKGCPHGCIYSCFCKRCKAEAERWADEIAEIVTSPEESEPTRG